MLNSTELDDVVVQVMVTARSDGYAQGYEECANHVSHALKVKWYTTRSAVHGMDTNAAYAAAKANYDQLQIPVLSLIDNVLPHQDFVERLKEIFAGADEEVEQGIGKTPI